MTAVGDLRAQALAGDTAYHPATILRALDELEARTVPAVLERRVREADAREIVRLQALIVRLGRAELRLRGLRERCTEAIEAIRQGYPADVVALDLAAAVSDSLPSQEEPGL